MASRRAPRHHSSAGCSRTLTVLILPLAIYVFQLLGKASGAAAMLAGMLIVLKVMMEWHQQQNRPHQPRQPPVPLVRRAPQAPLAGCYFCQDVHVLRPYHLGGGMRVGVCSHCYRHLRFSRWTP